MANGHGGARPGSGPKRDPATGKVLNPYKRRDTPKSSADSSRTPAVDAQVVTATPAQPQPMFSHRSVEALIEAMREMKPRGRAGRTPEFNPYVIRPGLFGPVSQHIKSAGRKLAMDDNTALTASNQFAVQAWQTGAFGADESEMFLGYPRLAQMNQRPEFRLFGEIMSEEMTRKWIEWRGTDDESTKEAAKPKDRNKDDDESDDRKKKTGEGARSDNRNKEIERKIVELKQFADEINLRGMFKTVAQQDSDYGIAHLYLDLKGANVDDIRDPENAMSIGNGRNVISKEKLGAGCLQGLRVIEPVWCYPTAYNASNPLSRDWYDPQVWYVMGAEIHKTRLLPFIGRPVSELLRPAYAFGGLSMTQMAQPYVDIWLRTRESVGEIIHAFSVMILLTNMATKTQPGGSGGGNGDIVARMMLANWLRDNQGMMVIDKNTEDFKNISAPLGGLDELQAQAQEHMFSVGRIPAVKFAGIQPKGLNATSEGEMRAFNDTVHGRQEFLWRPGLTSVSDIMQISLWGERDPDITLDFLSLMEETPKEKGEIRKLEAETDQIRIDSGVVSPEEVRGKIAADVESGFHGIDPDDVPDLLEEEEGGLIPPGAGKGVEAELGNAGGGGAKPPAAEKKPGAEPSGEDEAEDGDFTLFDGALDSHKEPEHKVTIEYDGDFNMGGLIRHMHRLGAIGASRTIKAADENDDDVQFGFDGDGADKIHVAIIDGVDVLKNAGASDEWNEGDHPRGQPGNAGQFGSGGGGSSGKRDIGKRIERLTERRQGGSGERQEQMGEREGGGKRQMGEKTSARAVGKREAGAASGKKESEEPGGGTRQMAQASKLYRAPTKTPDEIVAAFPGGAEAIARTRARLAAVVPTDSLVSEGGFKNPDGTYTPEREAIHRKIAASFFDPEKVARALPPQGEKPVLTMLGGRGGSGKSWLTGEHGPVNESTSILLDSDAIKGMLPGYEGWNASAFHEESSHILQMADARALELGVNTIHDATLKSEATAVMRMAQYEAAGYEVEGYYMYAAPETAATRAMSRYAKGGKFNGRFVPPEIILGNTKNEANFDKLSGGFRKWAVYDNNAEGKEGPKLISRSGD